MNLLRKLLLVVAVVFATALFLCNIDVNARTSSIDLLPHTVSVQEDGGTVHRTLLFDLLGFIKNLFDNDSDAVVTTPNLSVRQVNEPGFGDLANQYSFSMASFKGHVYVGTLNSATFRVQSTSFFFGLPFLQSKGSKVYKGTRQGDGSWKFDTVLDFASINKSNFGSRKMLVVDDYLYLVTANHDKGLEVWQTTSGDDWSRVSESGFGDSSNISGRGMVVCGGYIYIGAENRQSGAHIWRRKITLDGALPSLIHI